MAEFPLSPNGITYPQPDGRGLDEWKYYIVSKIEGSLRPMALIRQDAVEMPLSDSGRQVVHSCEGIMTILSDPANRFVIESERSVAIDYYHHSGKMVTSFGTLLSEYDPALHEFPLTQTCALLGASSVMLGPEHPWVGLTFEPTILQNFHSWDHPETSGMVIVDITDLEDLRYGIMTFNIPADEELLERMDTFEVGNQCRPLSAIQYVATYLENTGILQENDMNKARKLEQFSTIGESTVNFTLSFNVDSYKPLKSLRDKAISVLIRSTYNVELFDMSIFDRPRLIPDFKRLLRQHLFDDIAFLLPKRSVGQLLALAFEGATQLDLVRFRGISAVAIGAALKMEELKDVTSISFHTDDIHGSHDEVLDALSCSPSLHRVCFLLIPNRASDIGSLRFFQALSNRPQLFKRLKLTFTGAFSQALHREPWLQPWFEEPFNPPVETSLVLNMLVSYFREEEDGYQTPVRNSFYLGNGLLGAEAFVAGFLRWLPNMPSFDGFPFSVGPSHLGSTSNAEVHPVLSWTTSEVLRKGSWIVFVSRGLYDDEVAHFRGRHGPKKYAFIRLGVELNPQDFTKEPLRYHVKPGDLQVLGLKEFLQFTAPKLDQELVDRLLLETKRQMASADIEGLRGPEFEWLEVFDVEDACGELNWFLKGYTDGLSPLSSDLIKKGIANTCYM
ncbi:hypothetical protein F4781DRAFT_445460 [Annulohypoxylon bovei var. microspora]|nr:hypothetical protein F4781DRAFT_445460 [Annulohypoxylon bovei var. microspora]